MIEFNLYGGTCQDSFIRPNQIVTPEIYTSQLGNLRTFIQKKNSIAEEKKCCSSS